MSTRNAAAPDAGNEPDPKKPEPATAREADIDAAEASLREQLVAGAADAADDVDLDDGDGDGDAGDQEPNDGAGDDAGDGDGRDDDPDGEQSGDGEQAGADGQAMPGEDAGGDQAKPADEEVEPDEDPDDQRFHPKARRRIRRLLAERKRHREALDGQTKALDELATVCHETGLPPEAAAGTLALAARALVRRDPEALARLGGALEKAGYRPQAASAAAAPGIDLEALRAAVQEAEENFDFTKVRAILAAPSKPAQPTTPPAAAPTAPAKPAAPTASADPAQVQWQAALQQANAEIFAAVGPERAKQVGAAIKAQVEGELAKADPSAWPAILRVAVRAALARAKPSTPAKPPAKPGLPAGGRPPAASPLDKREADLRRLLVG